MRTTERRPHYRFRYPVEDADPCAEEGVMVAAVEKHAEPWTCDPCGSTNTVDRGNCAFCGKAR